jgi:hypothetical protein
VGSWLGVGSWRWCRVLPAQQEAVLIQEEDY